MQVMKERAQERIQCTLATFFFWKNEWNKKALKIEKQLKQKSGAISQLKTEK